MKEKTTITSSGQMNKTADFKHQTGQVGAIVIGGSFQGLGLLRSLARHNIPTYLVDNGTCIARFSKYTKRFCKCPDVTQEDAFMEFLLNLARKENLGGWVIYPNDDETLYFLAKHKEWLEKHYRITTPPWDVVKFAYNKRLTYELANKCGIAIPRTFYPTSAEDLQRLDIEFPVILKPSIKEPFFRLTRKKAIRVDNRTNLMNEYAKAALIADGSQMMVQELIPGGAENLFSVGSLCRDGQLLARVVVRRPRQHPMDFGHATTYAETVYIPALDEIASKILGTMGYYGLSEVEFMFDPRDSRYKLLEINARVWGWHTIAIGAGVDLPYLSYLDTLGEKVHQDGFTTGVKWIRLHTDVPTVLIELFKGRMKISDYLKSLRGRKEFAVLSIRDPLPFFMEFVLLPYLWKKKGFW
jgi:predicted ATP-grasp superfamily ATP-dependent carboligase